MGIIGMIFGVSALVLGGILLWDAIVHPDTLKPTEGPLENEEVIDAIIELANMEYAYTL